MQSLEANAPSRELPRYKSHKVVHALKIKDVQINPTGPHVIVPADEGFAPFGVDDAYVVKHEPAAGGYFVLYPDGYESYSPKEAFESGYTVYEPQQGAERATPEKTLHNSDISGARKNVPDIKVVGNGDSFQLLCKASSENEGWMKSSKAMEIPGMGCLVQVTTQQRNIDGSYAVAEALAYVPGGTVVEDVNGGRRLISTAPSV